MAHGKTNTKQDVCRKTKEALVLQVWGRMWMQCVCQDKVSQWSTGDVHAQLQAKSRGISMCVCVSSI